MMIRTHEFNSAWWGNRVGIVDDPAFFQLAPTDCQEQLAQYAWVEYIAPFDTTSPATLADAGFFQADTQIPFKAHLQRLPALPDFARLDVVSAVDAPFTLTADRLAVFEHERYRYLPGITPERLNDRYARFANALIAQQPEWCFTVLHKGVEQGWFLCSQSEHGFGLTLAMLCSDATVSGMAVYQSAMTAFGERGQTLGAARFSITNTAVHNIYAKLGARFLTPQGCWLWIRPS